METQDKRIRHGEFDTLLRLLKNRQHVFLVGPAGSGKTHAVEVAAQVLGIPFYCQSVGAQTSITHLLGFMDATGQYRGTAFRRAYQDGGVFLLDEIDAGNANVLTVLNAALANEVCSFPDGMVKRHADCRCAAAGNTWGQGANRQYIGRNALDAATLDRFAFLEWGYDEDMERQIAGNPDWVERVQDIRWACKELDIKMVVSPRASIEGAVLLSDGFERKRVEEVRIWKGCAPDIRAKIEAKVMERRQKLLGEAKKKDAKAQAKKKPAERRKIMVGDMVRIADIVGRLLDRKEAPTPTEEASTHMAGWGGGKTPSKANRVGKTGKVTDITKFSEDGEDTFKVDFGDDFWRYTERMLEKVVFEKSGGDGSADKEIRTGTKVRILPDLVERARTQPPHLDLDGSMEKMIGQTFTAASSPSQKGTFCAIENSFLWNKDWVEVVSQPEDSDSQEKPKKSGPQKFEPGDIVRLLDAGKGNPQPMHNQVGRVFKVLGVSTDERRVTTLEGIGYSWMASSFEKIDVPKPGSRVKPIPSLTIGDSVSEISVASEMEAMAKSGDEFLVRDVRVVDGAPYVHGGGWSWKPEWVQKVEGGGDGTQNQSGGEEEEKEEEKQEGQSQKAEKPSGKNQGEQHTHEIELAAMKDAKVLEEGGLRR